MIVVFPSLPRARVEADKHDAFLFVPEILLVEKVADLRFPKRCGT
jgi:hypothetical protein